LSKSVLWIGGAQWAGKTSVARILSERHGLQLYQYDYHDSRGHAARAAARPDLYPHLNLQRRLPAEVRWVQRTPEEMAADDLRAFDERFRMTVEDLSALPASPTVLAEGWGLRPGLLAPLLDSPRRAIFLVPSDRFRERQLAQLPRAGRVSLPTSDPDRAQRNRLDRDRLLTTELVGSARLLSLRTVTVDGTLNVDEVADLVAEHFHPFLPPARPRFDEYLENVTGHVHRGEHDAALGLALEARDLLPERAAATWLWVAAAQARSGRHDEALATVEEAAKRDLTWRLAAYESLEPIRDHPRFLAAMEVTRARLRYYGAKPAVRTWAPVDDPGRAPLLLCLPGANASPRQFEDLAPGLAAAGWTVVCGQSSQPTAPGLGCWDDPERADADLEAFLRLAPAHRPEDVAVAGFSQGASVAVRAALGGRAPLGFVALAPVFSPRDRKDLSNIAPSASRVRGIMWLGDRDPWLSAAREASETLRSASHDVEFEVTPGRGHSFSWEMTAMVPELLSRWRRETRGPSVAVLSPAWPK